MGMKREAVQEERQRGNSNKNGGGEDDNGEGSILGPGDMPTDRILEAERICDKHEREQLTNEADDIQTKFKFAAEKQLTSLVEWAKQIPHFTSLCLDDQVGGHTDQQGDKHQLSGGPAEGWVERADDSWLQPQIHWDTEWWV